MLLHHTALHKKRHTAMALPWPACVAAIASLCCCALAQQSDSDVQYHPAMASLRALLLLLLELGHSLQAPLVGWLEVVLHDFV